MRELVQQGCLMIFDENDEPSRLSDSGAYDRIIQDQGTFEFETMIFVENVIKARKVREVIGV